ncbi:TIM barrel protein [Sulfitobacter sp. M57]|uniref:hydroxypyruvate isomerase family protein n=1 Tax=unclassified Sulfitobacter TaxID=196795 RepID=UPI0023E3473D|nr:MULTISPECIES: TIM barrel protein [unclassified Sulfitobacter]MDF3415266.1 TIM barrel protein [Sulfitobacter sp. KE5]MDF3422747.1 TIM barrel protein [Sulfitobacter sp. KE43]MDF3433812.1 TIM barrel protein [Sulfitobacter sp. KE42]MDF3459452.1 TIM barrel protein [Sulfitobacter sp. S74]MDF3463351.1 TIM barrel protein [Sulfitobacter sp. Ks18]
MPLKFAANLSHLWPELPYLDRFAAAAAAGFDAVEVLFPYEVAAKETKRALIANGQRMILINAPPPNYTGGARGFAAQPEVTQRFQNDMRRAFRYTEALGVSCLHVMTGAAEGAVAKQTLIDNLKWAADAAPGGVTLTLEPLNSVAQPGYFLNDYGLAAEVLHAVDAPNVGLQFDSYHAQMIHGDAVAVFDEYLSLIRHVQVGDSPDRGAPGTGNVDFVSLFDRIEISGYTGWVSGEYSPNGPTEDSLGWMNRETD